MNRYAALGVRTIINAKGRLTHLGGSLMPESVVQAMAESARSFVEIDELQRQAGRHLAKLTHNEAAYICNSATAGLFLSILACMTGTDARSIARLPRLDGLKNEIAIHRSHASPFDLVTQLSGARFIEFGSSMSTSRSDFEAVLGDRTAAVLYLPGEHLNQGVLPLAEVIRVAHSQNVPVIVDAAAQLPPPENLWHFTRDLGADLAVFSGGKALSGPQASGLIVGKADLIAACFENGSPHLHLARGMKVGKEEMVGLVAAVEWYLQQDHRAHLAELERIVRDWNDCFNKIPGVRAKREFQNESGQPLPRTVLELDPQLTGHTASGLCQALIEGHPPIAAGELTPTSIYLTPDTLQPSEEVTVAERITMILSSIP